MKLQFGILYRDERVADRQDLETLLGDYASWNAETSGQFFDGSLLMGYRGDRITWEEDSEAQPFSLGPYTITFDGRLDNREDIAAKIGITANQNLPDPSLILQAYEKYGDSLLPDLIGEFALVIWRSDTRELTLCRSVDGARPLYYYSDARRFMWCSSIAEVVYSSGASQLINEQYMLDFMLCVPASDMTPFNNICAIKAGTLVTIGRTSTVQRSIWEPRTIKPLHLQSDYEYEEALRYHITEAVRVRLRVKGDVFADLSGGLDSSSVALSAATLIQKCACAADSLHTISLIYDRSRTTDESYFIKLVEKQLRANSIRVYEDEQRFDFTFSNITFTGLPSIYDLSRERYVRYAYHMRQHKSRVLLTGAGGDHIFCSQPYPEALIADRLFARQFVEAHRLCKEWSRFSGVPYYQLFSSKALPLVLKSHLPSWRYDLSSVPSWLNLPDGGLRFSRDSWKKNGERLMPSRELRISIADILFRTLGMGLWNNYRDLYVSHPFNHRPLVAFCIAVPMSQWQRNAETRCLLRRALRDLLPQKTATRHGKCFLNEPFSRAVQKAWNELENVAEWQVCVRGYVRAKELQRCLRQMRIGVSSDNEANSAPLAIAAERFLRSLCVLQKRVAN